MGMSHLLAMISLPKRNEASASGPFFREASRWFNNPLIRPGKISWRMGYVAFGGGCGPLDLWIYHEIRFYEGIMLHGNPLTRLHFLAILGHWWAARQILMMLRSLTQRKGFGDHLEPSPQNVFLLTEQRWPKMKGLHILTIFFNNKNQLHFRKLA